MSASFGSTRLSGVNDERFPPNYICTTSSNCASIAVDGGGVASVTLMFPGAGVSLHTIVFMINNNDNSDGNLNMERWYGSDPVWNGPGNTQITQSGGTNFPSMIADIDDGAPVPGPASMKYIHLRATGSFGLNEIWCYERKRLVGPDATLMTFSHNGHIDSNPPYI